MTKHDLEQFNKRFNKRADTVGNLLIEFFHYFTLFVVGIVIICATVLELINIFSFKKELIDGILMLFIYIELSAMVSIYFKTKRIPVRFLIYVSITALTRLLISDISHNHKASWGLIQICAAILILSVAVLIIRFASSRFHNKEEDS